MTLFFRIFLLISLSLFFLLLFALRAFIVWRQTGKNPLILQGGDNAHSLLSRYLVMMMLLLAAFVLINFFAPHYYDYFLPIAWLDEILLKDIGAGLLIIALVFTYIAQAQMRSSWRVGIDEETKTELVAEGLFRYSRNPIYLGMILALLGVFLIAPTGATLLIFVLCYVLMQIQIRLEEEHLTRLHGQRYLDYKKKVRRWI